MRLDSAAFAEQADRVITELYDTPERLVDKDLADMVGDVNERIENLIHMGFRAGKAAKVELELERARREAEEGGDGD